MRGGITSNSDRHGRAKAPIATIHHSRDFLPPLLAQRAERFASSAADVTPDPGPSAAEISPALRPSSASTRSPGEQERREAGKRAASADLGQARAIHAGTDANSRIPL